MKAKKFLSLISVLLLIVICFTGCGAKTEELIESQGNTYLTALNGKRIGVLTASIQAILLPDMVPDAEIVEFNAQADMIGALLSNKIDSLATDESAYKSMLWENLAVGRIEEPIAMSEYGIIFGKNKNHKLQEEFNTYLAKIKKDGSHNLLKEKWFANKEPAEFESYDNLDSSKGKLKIGISSSSKPYVYAKNGKYTGFEIELITGFCKEYGYSVEFDDTAFGGILAGVSEGKYDMGMSGVTITEERMENVDFSDITHSEALVLVIKSAGGNNHISQFNEASLGVVTGSLYGKYSREQFPDATIKEFNNFADVLVALKQNKVDAIMLDKPNFNSVVRTNEDLQSVDVPECFVELGFGFQKNEGGYLLQSQMNEFLAKCNAEGKTQDLIDRWFGETEPNVEIPLDELFGDENILNVSIDTTRKPFVYMYNGEPVGFEIEALYMFCKEYGYNIRVTDVSFASGLAGLASEKYDVVCGGLYMTDERKQSVNFSDPYMLADVVMAKYDKKDSADFIASVVESFKKTFIKESRWKLIVGGICTTMTISICSVLFGSLLGFLLYLLTRNKRKWFAETIKMIIKFYTTIIAGTPTLVVLMLLFYVVFASPDMSGILVAIVGFTLTFASYVYSNLSLTVSGVDNGQLEAAYALGYSGNKAFFKIIFPQAMKMFVPGYSAEIISLIKATSIVGYIAVNDLTKVGDIIRGNTYEAFFPLIAVAVIYFAITWIITGLLTILKRKTEPKRRKSKNILKGVVR